MPQFTYQALAAAGGKVSGTLEATTRAEAYRQLEALQRRSPPAEPHPSHLFHQRTGRPA
jgi:type II secretory pathway component PulF